MTGLLRDVMDARADSLDLPDLDLAAMVREGDLRLARRRRAVAGGLLAASLVVAAGVAIPSLRTGGDVDSDAAGSVHSYDVAYAVGSTIHDGPRTIATGVRISALVQGISGYVVADRQGRVHTVVDGETTQVGRLDETDRGRIMSDDDVVAWVDAGDGGTLSVIDLATGERRDVPVGAFPGEPVSTDAGRVGGGGARIAAVDGRTVYVTDARGVMAWDALDDEEPELLPAPDGVEVEVVHVQDGQILQVARSFEPQETDGSTTMVQVEDLRIGTDLQDTRSLPGSGGRLSPDGRRVALYQYESRPGSLSYYTTTVGPVSGDTRTPVVPRGYDSVIAYQWLDVDTFAALGRSSTAEFAREDVLSCEASTAECTVVVPDRPEEVVVATGGMSR
ncbi:MAG: hypothetical protein LH477_12715 [Nocardioides sp.]|nr:hypothetical protein [Nocardioides sp.]